jgi:hypothetical protein
VVWALYVQVLRELAHHCGHADILREPVRARWAAEAGMVTNAAADEGLPTGILRYCRAHGVQLPA